MEPAFQFFEDDSRDNLLDMAAYRIIQLISEVDKEIELTLQQVADIIVKGRGFNLEAILRALDLDNKVVEGVLALVKKSEAESVAIKAEPVVPAAAAVSAAATAPVEEKPVKKAEPKKPGLPEEWQPAFEKVVLQGAPRRRAEEAVLAAISLVEAGKIVTQDGPVSKEEVALFTANELRRRRGFTGENEPIVLAVREEGGAKVFVSLAKGMTSEASRGFGWARVLKFNEWIFRRPFGLRRDDSCEDKLMALASEAMIRGRLFNLGSGNGNGDANGRQYRRHRKKLFFMYSPKQVLVRC